MAKILAELDRRWRDTLSRWQVPADQLHVAHVNVAGAHLLVRDNEDVGRLIRFHRTFELAEARYLERVIRRDAVCLDIGANVGYFTVLMAARATAGRVYAFEPLPLNAALLAASIAMNGFDHVHLVRSAVGAESGTIDFAEAADSAYSSIRDTGRKPVAKRLTVPIVTIDDFVAAEAIGPVDVLKCDVEGAEGIVLDGAAALLADPARQPAAILIELYQPNLDLFGTTVSAIIARLLAAGYAAHTLADDGRLVPHDPATPSRQYNFVFVAPRGMAAFR